MVIRSASFCTAIFALTMSLSSAQDRATPLRKSLIGKAPPELVAEPNHWLGKAAPVTLAQLKGQVVWLQFNF
jgi:hypothetical protein